jgi:hypothetical protein
MLIKLPPAAGKIPQQEGTVGRGGKSATIDQLAGN